MGEKSKRRDAESKGRGEMQRVKGGGAAECYFRFRVRKHPIYTCFLFFKCWPS
jgi:hypothetical protein